MPTHNTVHEQPPLPTAAAFPNLVAEEWHRSAIEAKRWRERLEAEVRRRYAALASAIAAARIDSDASLDGMLAAVTADAPDVYAHAYRVAALSVSAARLLGVDDREIAAIERGALLHDLGKLAMPEAILRKPAPLTAGEQTIIRMHPRLASELVGGIPYLRSAAGIVAAAHERLDGNGYPHGLRGARIPLGARIVAAADAYDTMIRPRVFRDAISPAEALRELERCSGTQFDGRAANAIAQTVRN